MPSNYRRQILAGLGSLTFLSSSGCVGESPSTRLRELYLTNNEDDDPLVTLQLSADDELVYEDAFELTWDGIKPLPCGWPTEATSYELSVRREDNEWLSTTFDSGEDECISIVAEDDTVGIASWGSCPTELDLGTDPCP